MRIDVLSAQQGPGEVAKVPFALLPTPGQEPGPSTQPSSDEKQVHNVLLQSTGEPTPAPAPLRSGFLRSLPGPEDRSQPGVVGATAAQHPAPGGTHQSAMAALRHSLARGPHPRHARAL